MDSQLIGAVATITGLGVTVHAAQYYCQFVWFPKLVTNHISTFQVLSQTDAPLTTENSNEIKEKKAARLAKFCEGAWKVIWHTFVCIAVWKAIQSSHLESATLNPWINGTAEFWNTDTPMTTISRLLYWMQMGYYSIGLLDIIFAFVFPKVHDRLPMTIHHIATLFLLFSSYFIHPCFQLGIAVMFIHEITDITLYLSKLFHYAEWKTAKNIMFGCNIFVWLWLRWSVLSAYVWSVWHYGKFHPLSWYRIPGVAFLSSLLCLHIYWVSLMFRHVLESGRKSSAEKKKN